MDFFKLIAESRLALSRESELELDYICGNKLKDKELLIFQNKNYKGIFLQIILFIYRVLIDFKLFNKKNLKKNILMFSDTINQLNSLKTTADVLKKKNEKFNFLVPKILHKKNSHLDYLIKMNFNLNVVLSCLILFFLRALPLYLELKKLDQKNKISFRFAQYCLSYLYVPYFIDFLKKTDTKVVVISNDHSVSNRSLRLSAEILGVKTIYLQHASVSELFPPLEFDYSLLDGKIAHEIYLNCFISEKDKNIRIKKNIKNCQVILTGQKKLLTQNRMNKDLEQLNIGLAINELDNFNYMRELLDHIYNIKAKCIIRTHPSQDYQFIQKLRKYLHDKEGITWSDAREQIISDYFEKVNMIIAGNSSIHLEAAIAGLPTFYYEMSEKLLKFDYYGFHKNGISIELKKNFSLSTLKSLIDNETNSKQRNQAIKYYSETYGTYWQNKEGQLTANIIDKILNKKSFDEFFDGDEHLIYKKVWKLKEFNALSN